MPWVWEFLEPLLELVVIITGTVIASWTSHIKQLEDTIHAVWYSVAKRINVNEWYICCEWEKKTVRNWTWTDKWMDLWKSRKGNKPVNPKAAIATGDQWRRERKKKFKINTNDPGQTKLKYFLLILILLVDSGNLRRQLAITTSVHLDRPIFDLSHFLSAQISICRRKRCMFWFHEALIRR